MRKILFAVLVSALVLPGDVFAATGYEPAGTDDGALTRPAPQSSSKPDAWDRLASTSKGSRIRLVFTDGRETTGRLVRATRDAIVLSDLSTSPSGVGTPNVTATVNQWTFGRSEVSQAEIISTKSPKGHAWVMWTLVGAGFATALILKWAIEGVRA
jgi:hypothetical protein